jgi:hypothetical protein
MIILSLVISISTALIGLIFQGVGIVFISYGFVIPLMLFLPRLFYLDKQVKQVVKFKWVKKIEYYSFFLVLFNAFGSLILHDLGFQYDRFLHFIAGFLGSIIFLFIWLPVSTKLNFNRFLIFVFFLSIFGIFLWEGLQYSVDQLFGTKLFFDANQNIKVDFLEDVFFGSCGLILALFYAKRFSKNILFVLSDY